MFVLSRQVGQAIVIDDQIVVTVERFSTNDLELSLANVRAVPLGRFALVGDKSMPLPRGVDVVMIQTGSDKVRLGLSCADDSGTGDRIARKEIWDELRGTQ